MASALLSAFKLFNEEATVFGQDHATSTILINTFQILIAIIVFSILMVFVTLLVNTTKTPSDLKGSSVAAYNDYDALSPGRAGFGTGAPDYDPAAPMNTFQVATANFGGIFTENTGTLNPWIGSVSKNAVQLQVEAGARAVIFDIWPDPADTSKPVVCSMMDLTQNTSQNWWINNGLNQGVSRYSNWNLITRNKVSAGDLIKTAVDTHSKVASGDPFFLILKLHGAMTSDYLNLLGTLVNGTLTGVAMPSTYEACAQQDKICTAPFNDFAGCVCVIVIPDPAAQLFMTGTGKSYNALTPDFTTNFLNTTLGRATNYMEKTPNTVFFDPDGIATISQQTQSNCSGKPGDPQQSLAQKGFCVVQPSIGSSTTDNDSLFSSSSYDSCNKSGAQFVAVNLFSQKASDSVIPAFFDPSSRFGKYSFVKI